MKRYDFDTQEQRVLAKLVEEGIEAEQAAQQYFETEEGQERCQPLSGPWDDEVPVDPEKVDSITFEETLKRIQQKFGGET